MINKHLLCAVALGSVLAAGAETINVSQFHHVGPYAVQTPFMVDSVDVNKKSYTGESALDLPMSVDNVLNSSDLSTGKIPASQSLQQLHQLGFTFQMKRYAKVKIKVNGVTDYRLYVDGEKVKDDDVSLAPQTHTVVIKCLSQTDKAETVKVSLETDNEGVIELRNTGKRDYTLADVLHASKYASVDLSSDGKYLISAVRKTAKGGKTQMVYRVSEVSTGKILAQRSERIAWMPRSVQYYYVSKATGQSQLILVDPVSGRESVKVKSLPEGEFIFSPSEDYLLYSLTQEGPKERKDVYQVLEPEDRQPGWRDRSYPAKYDLTTGQMQPLTHGYHQAWIEDLSADGSKALLMTSASRLSKRPTTVFSLYLLDMNTLKAEQLVDSDGFFTNARFSPDAKQVLLAGSPEAFNGVGKNVKADQTPSMEDIQLYCMSLSDKNIKPLTKEFNPNVQKFTWNRADGQIYFNAENRDCMSLYRMNPATGAIKQITVPEDMVNSFALAGNAPMMAWYGQGASNSDKLYTMSTKTLKSSVVEDLNAGLLADVELGECQAWDFVNSRGDTICGRFYLPTHFDANHSYPLIVNYYGGCSPTSRNFESRYPHNLYAAMGYVVYVVEPSGATGFGQEFSARHVNTAGEGVAQDIIEGTKRFCEEHKYVNTNKIGCIGASYGGFMTQYLQTQTDIFAAAISHAGISDHTSYWGEGYWGYSYSEVSMANSYPWSETDLYVKQSPLYNADKIHTPLLFLHGDADKNVPVGESIQLFTALKLLGRETAYVAVADQDHHILDYNKRIRWQDTIFAWFAKWLQDDPTWWESMYSDKAL
jgi:dipeptidyl aminopeptidase/acylaminoacyl peptidase